jgi:hypothetical protein
VKITVKLLRDSAHLFRVQALFPLMANHQVRQLFQRNCFRARLLQSMQGKESNGPVNGRSEQHDPDDDPLNDLSSIE